MAKRATMTTAKSISAEDLASVLDEISRQKGLASEYAGHAGKATQAAVERYGIDKTALTFSRRLRDMETNKRQATMRACLDFWEKLGFFDQFDAFDDVHEQLDRIANNVRERETKPARDPVASTIMQ